MAYGLFLAGSTSLEYSPKTSHRPTLALAPPSRSENTVVPSGSLNGRHTQLASTQYLCTVEGGQPPVRRLKHQLTL